MPRRLRQTPVTRRVDQSSLAAAYQGPIRRHCARDSYLTCLLKQGKKMASNVLYHCPCTSVASTSSSTAGSTHLAAPTPQHPAHPFAFHRLPSLYFCEECDSVRCNRCVSIEVSGYYCPNCLFEVPSASVRAEKNRYAELLCTERVMVPIETLPDAREIVFNVLNVVTRSLSSRPIPRRIPTPASHLSLVL